MLGKLFSRLKRKAAQPAAVAKNTHAQPASSTPAVQENTPKARQPNAQQLLATLTQGQSIDSIVDHELLNQLLKHSEQLDKKTNRQIRERLRVLREQEKAAQAQREQQEKLCQRLETLARLQHHPLYDSEFRHACTQWQALTAHDADLTARVQTAIDQCEQQIALAAAQQQAAEAAAQAEAQRAAEQQQRAQKAAEMAADRARQAAEHEQEKQQQHARQKTGEAQRREAEQTIRRWLDEMEQALAEANAKQARTLQDRIRDKLKTLPAESAHHFEGRLHLLLGQLRELQDWQDYAALPKLEALCNEMEKLAQQPLPDAIAQADAVRTLQQQWRDLKPPASSQVHNLWERFRQSGDIAWQPCAEHFGKEKALRAFNREQREAICSALETFASQQDWQQADWAAVTRILDKARQEFHQFHPVERHDDKPLRQRFDSAIAPIAAQLLHYQQQNEARKQQLIDTAVSLAGMTDNAKAAERVKQLQAEWKLIPHGRRHQDQQLWQQFQLHCNAVFEQRRAQHEQQRQAQASQIETAQQLCAQIAALATLDDQALAQSQETFEQLQAQFRAITDLPEKQQASLKKQFHQACDQYRSQLLGISKRQHQRQLQQLAALAHYCEQIEHSHDPALADTLAAQWQPQGLPAEWQQRIQQRYEQAQAIVRGERNADHAQHEAALRQLCIEMEILTGRETPEEDKARRREYQMQALKQGLGQAAGNINTRAESLLVQWYCSPAAPAACQTQLWHRFTSALPADLRQR